MENNTKLGTIGMSVGLLIAGLVSGYMIGHGGIGNDAEQTAPPTTDADWQMYRNDEYGFEFNYPVDWGEVVIKEGNRKTQENTPCGGPFGEYAPKESIFLVDKEISFSAYQRPISFNPNFNPSFIDGGFKLTKYDAQKPTIYYCKDATSGINLTKDKEELGNSITDTDTSGTVHTRTSIKNINGVKVLYYPDWYDPLGTGISQFYKFYGDNVLVQAGMGFTPTFNSRESIEAKSFECEGVYNYGECGLTKWVREGKTSEKVRQVFATFEQILSTFRFTR